MKWIAIAIALLTSAVHIFVGSFDTLAPALTPDLEKAVSIPLTGAWHMVSLFLLGSVLAFWRGGEVGKVFAGLWLASGVMFLYLAIAYGGMPGLLEAPQWIVLLPGGLTGYFASR